MVENGTAILSLDEISAMADDLYFPVSGIGVTSRVSWETMKAGLTGGYEFWPHDIPGSTDEILTVRNKSGTDEFSIFEVRSPESGALLEATLALHLYSVAFGEDWLRDLTMQNYDGPVEALDVLSDFSGATYGNWKWISKILSGGTMHAYTKMELYGATGNLELGGNLLPVVNDTQDLGGLGIIWSNGYIGYVKAAAVKVTGSFRFDDGSTVYNGATGTFTAGAKAVTVKGGIITGIV
jgi:hypothetical protein